MAPNRRPPRLQLQHRVRQKTKATQKRPSHNMDCLEIAPHISFVCLWVCQRRLPWLESGRILNTTKCTYFIHSYHSYRLPLLLCFSSNHTSVPLLHLNTYITVSVEVSVMTAGQSTDDSSKGTFICSVEWTLWKQLRLQLSVTMMIVAMTFWSMYMHRIDECKRPLYTCTHAKSQPLLALLGLIVFGSELPYNLCVFKLCLSRLFSFCSMLLAPSRSGWAA